MLERGSGRGIHRTHSSLPPDSINMPPVLHDDPGVASTAWLTMFISILPPGLVRVGEIVLGSVICVCNVAYSIHPKPDGNFENPSPILQVIIDSGVLIQADELFTAQVERDMGRLRYRVSDLQEKTLLISGGIISDVKAVSHRSYEKFQCLRDMDTYKGISSYNAQW